MLCRTRPCRETRSAAVAGPPDRKHRQDPARRRRAGSPPTTGWAGYRNGPAFVRHLQEGGSPRAVFNPLQGFGPAAWPRLVAAAVAAVRASGRGAVVVVPDYRDLNQLEQALLEVLPAD